MASRRDPMAESNGETRNNRNRAMSSSIPVRPGLTIRAPTTTPNTHLTSTRIRTSPERQIEKEGLILVVALRWYLCLSSANIISTLDQYFAANPEKRPASFPYILDQDFVDTAYHGLVQEVRPPLNRYMRDFVECMTDLRWRRFAANVYRGYRPENEADPIPEGLILTEDRQTQRDYTQSKPIDMNEIHEFEGSRLCIALRTWIGEYPFAPISYYCTIAPYVEFQEES